MRPPATVACGRQSHTFNSPASLGGVSCFKPLSQRVLPTRWPRRLLQDGSKIAQAFLKAPG